MKLTEKSYKELVNDFRAIYGPTCLKRLDIDKTIYEDFFRDCQKLIPEEVVDEVKMQYFIRRTEEPWSAEDIVSAYIEKLMEDDTLRRDPIGVMKRKMGR